MKYLTCKFMGAFLGLMASMFLMYFIAVGLSGPAKLILEYMNNKNTIKPLYEWFVFWPMAALATGLWAGIWLCFKTSEKICMDVIFHR